MNQLTFWRGRYPWSDPTSLLVKLVHENKLGIKNNYHFCGVPL